MSPPLDILSIIFKGVCLLFCQSTYLFIGDEGYLYVESLTSLFLHFTSLFTYNSVMHKYLHTSFFYYWNSTSLWFLALSLSLSLRAVKYHRALGVLFWIFATLHMLIYQVKWLQKGTLATNAWQNVRSIPRNSIDIWRYLFPLFCRITLDYLVSYYSLVIYCMFLSCLRLSSNILFWIPFSVI